METESTTVTAHIPSASSALRTAMSVAVKRRGRTTRWRKKRKRRKEQKAKRSVDEDEKN